MLGEEGVPVYSVQDFGICCFSGDVSNRLP